MGIKEINNLQSLHSSKDQKYKATPIYNNLYRKCYSIHPRSESLKLLVFKELRLYSNNQALGLKQLWTHGDLLKALNCIHRYSFFTSETLQLSQIFSYKYSHFNKLYKIVWPTRSGKRGIFSHCVKFCFMYLTYFKLCSESNFMRNRTVHIN